MKKSSYDTYVKWLKHYSEGTVKPMSKSEFNQIYTLKKDELKSQGLSTTNISKKLASSEAFQLDIKAGRNIRKIWNKEVAKNESEKISLREARNLTDSDLFFKATTKQQREIFSGYMSNLYHDYRSQGLSSKEASEQISVTIFGSPE